ncbi:hypothetical protein ACH4HG_33950 [Streptomyces coeruleorubidus]|uniref:hypothetical protein n=1 Tax=Streptomyces coeruleorubidus TaxID=116188 RepID=UPI0019AEC186|nr:hypothetical protein GCM10010244_68050 [Streptomyces bellus]
MASARARRRPLGVSVHHPELREILVPRRNAARQAVREFLAARGVADAESAPSHC